jgi:hypothetical protein
MGGYMTLVFWYFALIARMNDRISVLMTPRLRDDPYEQLQWIGRARALVGFLVISLTASLFVFSHISLFIIVAFYVVAPVIKVLIETIVAPLTALALSLWLASHTGTRLTGSIVRPVGRASGTFLMLIAPMAAGSIMGAVTSSTAISGPEVSGPEVAVGFAICILCIIVIPMMPRAIYLGLKHSFNAQEGHPWLPALIDIVMIFIYLTPFVGFPTFSDLTLNSAPAWIALFFDLFGAATAISLGVWEIRYIKSKAASA